MSSPCRCEPSQETNLTREPRRSPALAILLAALLGWPWAASYGQDDVEIEPERPAASAETGRVVAPRRAHGSDATRKSSPQLSATDDDDEDGDGPGRVPVSF